MHHQKYLFLVEQAEMVADIRTFNSIKHSIDNGDEELIPASVVNVLANGKNPINVWREYRQMTQKQVATEIGVSVPFISQLETAKRNASIDVMGKLAVLLKVDIDDLV